MEGDSFLHILISSASRDFNPLPPHGGRRRFSVFLSAAEKSFQSTPSAWRETAAARPRALAGGYFNPLPPHGGRLRWGYRKNKNVIFQSTPSAWRETNRKSLDSRFVTFQSTPSAWRETADSVDCHPSLIYFNPLPPHGGRLSQTKNSTISKHFNPLPPHGGRRGRQLYNVHPAKISIHSLRMEGDVRDGKRGTVDQLFQSTPSAWRETDFAPTAN